MSDSERKLGAKVVYLSIDENNDGQRIDNFLVSKLKGVPKSRIYRLLRKGEVRVNKSRTKPDYKLAIGDMVRIPPVRMDTAAPKPSASKQLTDVLEAAVLYEDNSLLVVNKPSGLAVHGGSGVSLGLIEALRSIREDARYLELVHRLDRDTSGCVMIAKKRSMLKHLHAQLRDGGIDKRYLALVEGRWPSRRQMVNVPLLKNELRSGERVVTVSPEGKKSRTEFSVVDRFKDATLVQAKPITGRTHQIRVHAKHVGHFILGDEKYGDPSTNKLFKMVGLKRLFLHAASLSLNLPGRDSILKVEAPLDKGLQQLLKTLPASGDS